MELDFQTLKALSSPTRIKILNQVLEAEATTTDISREIGKTKSTVSGHLTKLQDSGLVEKEEEDGRKRVIYRPTDKAKAIVQGKEKRVKFSITSSVVTGLVGVTFTAWSFLGSRSPDFLSSSSKTPSTLAGAEMEQGMNTMSTAAEKSVEAAPSPELVPLAVGIALLGVAVTAFLYGYLMNRLKN